MGTSAYYAPAGGTIQLGEASSMDKKRIIPSAVYCDREFGGAAKGYFVGVPALLGKGGVEKVVDFAFEGGEKALFDESVSHVQDLVGIVQKMFPELA